MTYNFKNVEKKYRPIPFWSWNEKLDTSETRRQVEIMDKAGIGGYFMHARGGLLTEYMGDEWFDNVEAASEEGLSRGMYPWAYDENGWPSGFGGGKVNGLGLDYQQKYLMIEEAECESEAKSLSETVLVKNGYRYYYKVNEFYVDVLDKKVVEKFLEEIYAEYERRMGKKIEGFFTDEPQITRAGSYPWSFTLPSKFKERYGYDLIEHLNELFFDEGDFCRTRTDYWKLVTDLFSENFFKQIYDWCESRGYKFTGHLVLEETLKEILISNGATMPHYEYFSIPGMDWLGRPVFDCLTPKALGSAAAQLGKRQVLSETFALAGHNVSHNELKRIYEWQMVRGINLLCTHLEGYSLRGIRKRDYPPAMYYQQPWWDDMDIFFDSMSRIGKLLAEGKEEADTLLLHNQTTAWMLYRGDALGTKESVTAAIDEYNKSLLHNMKALENKNILYHLGDETLIERHGRVEGNVFIVGNMRYTKVVIPENLGFLPGTQKLLDEFKRNGGIITTSQDIPLNPITEENSLTYAKRSFPEFDMHYFVNTTEETVKATVSCGNLVLDIVSGETKPFSGEHTFAPFESLVVIDSYEMREEKIEKSGASELSLLGEWNIKSATMNSITLDRCDYYVDGELRGEKTYVLDILPRLNELRREVNLTQIFRFRAEYLSKKLFVAVETPEIFEITLNGKPVSNKSEGFFRDKSFELIDIASFAVLGENELVMKSKIVQTPKTYEHLSNSWTFESMKNSLSYDMEIEPIYIVGDFGAKIIGEREEFEPVSYRINEVPIISEMPVTVSAEALDACGFPEFAGELVLERKINLSDVNKKVNLVGRGMNSVGISVNGKKAATKLFAPYDVDLSDYLKVGENTLELRILNNLRNMLGPHHLKAGDSAEIAPRSFYREANVFMPNGSEENHDVTPKFDERIALVYFGLV